MINRESPRIITQLHAELMAADPNCALTLSALRRLVRTGEIKSCRVGRKYLVTHQAVTDFLTGQTQTKPATPITVAGIRRII